jgi:hypothetical protein
MPNGKDAVIELIRGMEQGKVRCAKPRTYKRAEEAGLIEKDSSTNTWIVTSRGKSLIQFYKRPSAAKAAPSQVEASIEEATVMLPAEKVGPPPMWAAKVAEAKARKQK